jgi:hypothetical protein
VFLRRFFCGTGEQRAACLRVPQLGLVAEREERLCAATARAKRRDSQHLVQRHVRASAARWRLRKRAVAARVAAQPRQRQEHLAREGHSGERGQDGCERIIVARIAA